MDTDKNSVENYNIFMWLYKVCSGIVTEDHKESAIQLLKIAKKNNRITIEQYYDLFMSLYLKIICGLKS